MKFIKQTENLREITAMALSPNKRFLAVGERHKNDLNAYVSFYDMKNNVFKLIRQSVNISDQTTSFPSNPQPPQLNPVKDHSTGGVSTASPNKTIEHLPSQVVTSIQKTIVSLCFSNDSKYLALIITDGTDSKAVAYDWFHKNRVFGQVDFIKQQIRRVTFNPKDNHQVCTSGNGHWKLWRVMENTFKAMNPFQRVLQSHYFTDHCWLENDHLVACTAEGEIIILENSEVKQHIDDAFNTFQRGDKSSISAKAQQQLLHVSCIKPYSKGFFIASDNGTMALWVRAEENNNTTGKQPYDFIRKWQPSATKKVKILSLALSPGEDFLAVACHNNNLGLVNIKSIGLNADDDKKRDKEVKFDLLCKGGFHSGAISCIDIAIQRPLIVTASRDDCTVRLWNYDTFNCELAKEYYTKEDVINKDYARPLSSVAIHPSGYYLAISFFYAISFYHIMHDDLRHYKNLDIKSCSIMKFTQGGHFFFALDKLNINIFNSYTLIKLHQIKNPSHSINDLVLGPKDQSFAVICDDGTIGRYALPTFQVIKEGNTCEKGMEMKAIDFIQDENEDSNAPYTVAVGGDKYKANIRIVNKTDMLREKSKLKDKDLLIDQSSDNDWTGSYFPDDGKFTQIKFIKTIKNKIQGFITGNDKGQLTTFTFPLNVKFLEQMNVHAGVVTKVIASPDYRYLFTTGADGSIFIFSLSEQQVVNGVIKQIDDEKTEDHGSLFVDDALADIVLVKKQEMEEWLRKKQDIQMQLKETKRRIRKEIKDYTREHDEKKFEIESQKEAEIFEQERRYEELKQQKENQDRQNVEAMRKLESNHYKAVQELEEVYEKKLYIESSNFLKLEQEKLEMKNYYEGKIGELRKQNQDAITDLLREFKSNLQKVQEEYEESKKASKNLQGTYEKKLDSQENEHEDEIFEIKEKHKKDVEKLKSDGKSLTQLQEEMRTEKKLQEDRRANSESLMLAAKKKKKATKITLEEKMKQITLLQQEKQEVEDKLKKRETDLYKYKFKIKDLQKSKHVLTHRTTEMRASLEPKETQIEKLKDQLLNLEKVFEKQMKKMSQLGEELQKKNSKIKQLTTELQERKEKTQEKEKTILKFAADVHKIVQTKDDKAYVTGIMKLNQDYVMSQAAYLDLGKKRDPEALEELDRQLRYMESSVATLKVNTIKNETRAKNDIKKRTKENTQLIVELNSIKFEEKKLRDEIQKKKKMIQDFENELNTFKRQGEETQSQASELKFEESEHGSRVPHLLQSSTVQRKTSEAPKGKGPTPFLRNKENQEDRRKINEMLQQLEENNQQILLQKLEIRSLKDQIIRLLEERGGIQFMGQNAQSNQSSSYLHQAQ